MLNNAMPLKREKSEGRTELARAFIAVALLLGLFAALGFAPRNDPAKTVAGLACSVVSENEASLVLGTRVRLLPSTGTLCRYVSTASVAPSLFVVARHDDDPSLGSGTHVVGQSLYVRRGKHTFVFTVVAPEAGPGAALVAERTLASALSRTMVAGTR